MVVGVGASRVRDLFTQAKTAAPSIIFIDELDAIGRQRGGSGSIGGHDEREQTLNQILTEMDGFDPSVGVIVLSATNRPEVLDAALLRPGRFDFVVELPVPDRASRLAILTSHCRNRPLGEGVDLADLAARTEAMTGADLQSLCQRAAMLAIGGSIEASPAPQFPPFTVDRRHFDDALSAMMGASPAGRLAGVDPVTIPTAATI